MCSWGYRCNDCIRKSKIDEGLCFIPINGIDEVVDSSEVYQWIPVDADAGVCSDAEYFKCDYFKPKPNYTIDEKMPDVSLFERISNVIDFFRRK